MPKEKLLVRVMSVWAYTWALGENEMGRNLKTKARFYTICYLVGLLVWLVACLYWFNLPHRAPELIGTIHCCHHCLLPAAVIELGMRHSLSVLVNIHWTSMKLEALQNMFIYLILTISCCKFSFYTTSQIRRCPPLPERPQVTGSSNGRQVLGLLKSFLQLH